jgi:hypothetical protein
MWARTRSISGGRPIEHCANLGIDHASSLRMMRRDYRAIDHLDRYESEGLTEDAEDVLDEEGVFAARRAADREMDNREGREGRLPRALEGEQELGIRERAGRHAGSLNA